MKRLHFLLLGVLCLALDAGAFGAPQRGNGHIAPAAQNKAPQSDHDEVWRSTGRDERGRPDVARSAPNTPPGWSKGDKKGWNTCDAPPGRTTNEGCSVPNGSRPDAHPQRDSRATRPGPQPRRK